MMSNTGPVKHYRHFLPKAALEVGAYYYGDCRNASVAKWTGTHFVYVRTKFGNRFPEDIKHPEDDDGFDLFFPYGKVEAAQYDRVD